MNRKTISVIIPIYNVREYLKQAVDSVLSQTYSDLEVILIDDGSDDGSGEICDLYAMKDDRVHAIHQKNGGVSSARFTGICAATGEYVAFVDGDDWIDSHMYEDLYKYMEGVDLVTSGFCKVFENSCVKRCDLIPAGIYSEKDEMRYIWENACVFENGIDSGISVNLVNKLFRTDIIRNVTRTLDHSIIYGEDAVLCNKYLLNSRSVCVTHESYYNYRMRDTSAVHQYDEYFLVKVNQLHNALRSVYENSEVRDSVIYKLERRTIYLLTMAVNQKMGFHQDIRLPWNILLCKSELFNKNVVLYGAGEVGQDYHAQIISYHIPLVAWVDKSYEQYRAKGMNVGGISKLFQTEYDIILLAVRNAEAATAIKDELINLGISAEKIIWKEPGYLV